jgi:hypothetical protein
VGALAHYLEAQGIPTTQISLIREHTEIIRPPRALWVPFELGRPLGVPENPGFQRQVLLAALELLNASEGPILANFPDEAPEGTASEAVLEGWSCPVGFASEIKKETNKEGVRFAFKREVAELRPWYDLSLERRNRTAVVDFGPDSAAQLLDDFAAGGVPNIPKRDLALATALRLAAQDLKAFYFEAATARPGWTSPASGDFNRWFWQGTAAGRILKAVKERCMAEADKSLRRTGAALLVPLDQA